MGREKILCVDDEKMIVEALKMELAGAFSAELVIETAVSASEALQIVDESIEQGDQFLIIISDQRMPDMTGEVLLAELNTKIPDALKILLTGYADIEAVQYAINNVGLYHYIQKPWDRENLILTIRHAIDKYRTKKALDEKTQQIIKLNEELEKKVETRTRQLKEAVKELESFSYTVSHDLKSPIRSIDYYTKFILEDYNDQLNDNIRSMLKSIRNICADMFELIDKLLMYAITANAELEMSQIDTDALFRQTFREIMASSQGRKVNLIIDKSLPPVYGDGTLFRQVVVNLLSNAVKFTRNRKEAVIHVDYFQSEDGYSFSITDNGVGFDMKYASRLFGIFERMHSKNEFEGSGIGLATVKKIIEKHGGQVSIESQEGKGTTVFFTMPAP